MDAELLAERLIELVKDKKRYMVAIAGPPGSGKTTLAKKLHAQFQHRGFASKIIPMDGFHLDNETLSKTGMLSRKGSPATFDVVGFIDLISKLAANADDISIPVFDRNKDISIADADVVKRTDQILIVEGNYLLIDEAPWDDLLEYWDQSVFLEPKFSDLEFRLVNRWLNHGLEPEEAKTRAQFNDLPNAKYVLDHSLNADIRIR